MGRNSVKNKILIVEDETDLGETLKDYLSENNYQTKLVGTLFEVRELLSEYNPDLILMDINLPDGNGLEFSKDLINTSSKIKIIILSAINDPNTRVEGLEVGAIDYITKPFKLKELMLRLRRIFPPTEQQINWGKVRIYPNKFELVDAFGKSHSLGQRERDLIVFLNSKIDSVVSRDEIYKKVWGTDVYPNQRTVDNYIVKIRKWIDSDRKSNLAIQNIRGVGYKLVMERNS